MTQETSTQTQAPLKHVSPLMQALKQELANINRIREGEVVEAIFLKKNARMAFFDLGKFGTGLVYGAELQNAKAALKTLNPGDKVAARIEAVDGKMGYVELSLSEAGKQKLWAQVITIQESGELTKVKITGANQGGLTADLLGLKAFLPTSQLSNDHAPAAGELDRERLSDALKKYIGEEFTVKVITVNPRTNKLIVSERETVAISSAIKEALEKYKVGDTVEALVSGIADFGIFVRFTDNPEIEGLVHISEIDHRVIDNPKEVVKLNEPVKVKILDIKDGRVFLSLKALKADPWLTAPERYKESMETEGIVHKFNPFGAIIDLEGGVQGMIHISEFGGAEEMKKALELKGKYQFVITSVKPEEKRITLKLKK